MTRSFQQGAREDVASGGRCGSRCPRQLRGSPTWQTTTTTTWSSSDGAGGGTLGHRLATNGAKVLWLERGRSCPASATTGEARRCWSAGKYVAPESWYDRHGHEFQPEVNYYVGGNTKFYGAALFRL